ncbi:AMP-binding protein [Sphingomonas bacterium]|uniref:AMP-binding protein n=1 Tax=Sphingomonas bacterium TaxID=1895847 RepID=UPI0020C5F4B4|nr:AMP-binding protein [Sphingomonas bacterium]
METTRAAAVESLVDETSMPGAVGAHPADLVTDAARRFGRRVAYTLVAPDGGCETLSFDEADRLSDAFAGFLIATLGLKPGNVVAVQLANGLPFPIVVFGAWKAGLVVSPINPYYTVTETRRQLLDCDARVLVVDAASVGSIQSECGIPDLGMIAVHGPGLKFDAAGDQPIHAPSGGKAERCWTLAAALDGEYPAPHVRHPVALYQYTGGTTGNSKAAIITAANLAATKSMVSGFFAGHGSPIAGGTALTALPLYHVFAFLFGMLVYIDAGTNNVIVRAAAPVSNLRPAFEGFEIDWMAGVDTLYGGLLGEEWFKASPPRMKFAIAGGAALRPTVALEWERLVGPLLEGYGLTETTGIVSCNPPTAARRIGSIGLPVTSSQVRIVDEAGAEVAPGTSGELLVRGPQVAAGYLDRANDADAFFGGWFRTGDVVVVDSLGMLTIMDRKKDMILVSGFNVYPNEVEAVLATHPDVAEAAVIGIASERTGEAVRAYVVLRKNTANASELDRHCRLSLAAYKVPKEFVIRPHLPKSPVGKILRAQLRTSAASR